MRHNESQRVKHDGGATQNMSVSGISLLVMQHWLGMDNGETWIVNIGPILVKQSATGLWV